MNIFWRSCNNPEQLFLSSRHLRSPSQSASLDSANGKKWSFKAEIVTFEIYLLDAIRVQGIAMQLEEFQFQYYLRNNLTLQLYGSQEHYGDTACQYDPRNSILLFEERLTTQHPVKEDGRFLMLVFLCPNRERFSSLSLRLRSKSFILHHIISVEVLEPKTYNKNT